MSANYWASTQWYVSFCTALCTAEADGYRYDAFHCDNSNNWLLDRPQLELARKQDLRYASRIECAALGVFFSNRKRRSLPLYLTSHPL